MPVVDQSNNSSIARCSKLNPSGHAFTNSRDFVLVEVPGRFGGDAADVHGTADARRRGIQRVEYPQGGHHAVVDAASGHLEVREQCIGLLGHR